MRGRVEEGIEFAGVRGGVGHRLPPLRSFLRDGGIVERTAASAAARNRPLLGVDGNAVCTENPIRVYRMIESAKLAR